jgi:1-deoxyxylulose-5-phosphate synthase
MEHVTLGRWGLRVSRLCLGTMVFGSQRDESESRAVLDRALELGIDFVDVADVYPVPSDPATVGRTEEIVGRWLRGHRHEVVVATKFGGAMGSGPNWGGSSRKHVIEACEGSIRRLQTDRIDVYYMHHWDTGAPLDEMLEAVDRLHQGGKVLYFGVSNYSAWQLSLALTLIAERHLHPIAALQPRFNLLFREAERDLLPLARATGMAVLPYNPLAAGILSGKYIRTQPPPPDSRFAWGEYGEMYRRRYWSDAMFDVVDTLRTVAGEAGMSPIQAALSWVLSKEAITAPIVGASRPEQLDETVLALELPLDGEALARLDEVSAAFV